MEEINICIIDDGIGIPGSFRDASIDYASESECIYNAIKEIQQIKRSTLYMVGD